jgi:DNA-binding NarL/FixJ family response regulator
MVAMNWTTLPPEIRELADRPGVLTKRQREILMAADSGMSDRQIARLLHLARSTVKEHRERGTDRLEAALSERPAVAA